MDENPRPSRQRRRAPLTLEEAAEYLNINPRHLRRLVQERRITYTRVGKFLRFLPDDLDDYLLANRIVPSGRHRP